MTGPEFDERAARERVAGWAPERVRAVSLAIVDNSAPLFDIEAAASCNLSCHFCPRDALARPQRIMTPATFAAVERFLPAGAVVMFAGLGEPLTNHHLPGFVARLKRHDVSPCVITNGMLMNRPLLAALIDAGIDQFQVSVHAIDRATFRRLVPEIDVDRLVANLHTLAEMRPPGLRVRLNFVAGAKNRGELPAVTALARELGFDLFVRAEHNRGGHLGGINVRPRGCGIFAAVTLITAQGDVLSCVNDVAGCSRLGNVSELLWEDVRAWKRKAIGSGEWFPACSSCDDGYRWVLLASGGLGHGDASPSEPP